MEQWKNGADVPQFQKFKYDKSIVIGRMEPPHIGHMHLAREAGKLGKEVIFILGSRNRARSIKNPWRADDREIMLNLAIEECVPELKGRFKIITVSDYSYNDQHWAKQVGLEVSKVLYSGFKTGGAFVNGVKVALVGHHKDDTSFYLDMFPQWKQEEIELADGDMLNATDIRSLYFDNDSITFEKKAKSLLPNSVMAYLLDWRNTEEFNRLKDEYEYIQKYKNSWKCAPYAPTFVTTDAVIIESGHVLMIRRGGQPGHGQWALPGGFLDAASGERVRDCVRRELVEETKIDVPPAMLLDLFKKAVSGVFDHPDRDLRGRIITHAFLIELPTRSCGLSKVKASDDAMKGSATWIPLYMLEGMSENGEIFSDHYDIIFNLTGKTQQG